MGKTTNILDLNNRLEKVEKEKVAQNNYNSLKNRPKINGNLLTGDKTGAQLGLAEAQDIGDLSALTTTNKTSAVAAINEVNSKLFNPSANYLLLGSAAIDGSNAVTVSLGDNNINDYDFIWIGNAYYDTGVATYGCVLVPTICMYNLYSGDAGVPIMSRDNTNTGVTPINAVYNSTNNTITFNPEGTPAGQYYFVNGIKIRTNS